MKSMIQDDELMRELEDHIETTAHIETAITNGHRNI